MEERAGSDGTVRYVTRDEAERGSKGPFLVAYSDADATSRWGYYCDNCGSFDTAMDSMGRIQCNDCRNVRKPDEWDAAHE